MGQLENSKLLLGQLENSIFFGGPIKKQQVFSGPIGKQQFFLWANKETAYLWVLKNSGFEKPQV